MKNQYYKLRVLREGLITTIQDNGFIKLQHLGITTGGAIDDFSYKLGNIILSNKTNTPSIEFAKLGPKFLVEHGSLNIAITGNVNFVLNGADLAGNYGCIIGYSSDISGCASDVLIFIELSVNLVSNIY